MLRLLDKKNSIPSFPTGKLFPFILAHVLLGLLLQRFSFLATIHAVVALLTGLYYAANGKMEKVAYVSAYIVGAEVLWRMTDATIPHEFGKYAISLIFFLSLVKGQKKLSIPGFAFVYFVLMLPSILLVLTSYDLSTAMEFISFNLSGPLALMMSVWFFLTFRFTVQQIMITLYLTLPPIISSASIAFYLIGTSSVSYNIHSAWARSGNYAPNQVSAILGLGAMLAYIVLIMVERSPAWFRLVLFGIVTWLAIQSSLTYSRSGVLGAALGAGVVSFFLIWSRRTGWKMFFTIISLVFLGGFFVIPQLINLTNGSIVTRFSSLDPTGRDFIMRGDLLLWEKNFWFGVGPGVSSQIRPGSPMVAAHTEFTRLLADHGFLGLLSNLMFLLMMIKAWLGAKQDWTRGIVAGFFVWAILFMFGTATRVVAPSFLFGLAFSLVNLIDLDNMPQSSTMESRGRYYVGKLRKKTTQYRD